MLLVLEKKRPLRKETTAAKVQLFLDMMYGWDENYGFYSHSIVAGGLEVMS